MAQADNSKVRFLTRPEMRELDVANSIRIPRRFDIGEVSLRKLQGSGDWALELLQDRGYCVEKRIVRLEDIVVLSLMKKSFKKLADRFESQVRHEDWEELNTQCSRCVSANGVKPALEVPAKSGKTRNKKRYGVVFVKKDASVLVVTEFRLPAVESAEWESPVSLASVEGGSRHC